MDRYITNLVLSGSAQLWEFAKDEYINQENLLIKKIKKSGASLKQDKEFYNACRFVSVKNLPVHNSKSLKSRVIGELYFADVILIIEKKKNWTLIEYNNTKEDIYIKGWVLTRYIIRFVK